MCEWRCKNISDTTTNILSHIISQTLSKHFTSVDSFNPTRNYAIYTINSPQLRDEETKVLTEQLRNSPKVV